MAFTAVIKANNGNLVLTQIAGAALNTLLNNVALPRLVTRAQDLNPQPRGKGDTIRCAVFSALASTIKPENAESDFQGVDPSTVTISLDQHLESAVRIGELAQLFSVPDLGKGFGSEIGMALARRVDSLLAGLYVYAGQLVGTFGTAFSDATALAARLALSKEEYPESGRFLVLHPDIQNEALAIDAYIDRTKSPNSQALEAGTLGMIRSFQVQEDARIVTTTSTGASRWHNLAFHRSAIALAFADLPNPNDPHVQTAIVGAVDSEGKDTGISVRMRAWYDPDEGTNKLVGDLLCGVKVIRPKGVLEVRR
jgi:hypothetical protein